MLNKSLEISKRAKIDKSITILKSWDCTMNEIVKWILKKDIESIKTIEIKEK